MTTRDRWLDEGLALLETTGIGAVTIEALCGRLSLSKGSFYHHFKGMSGYRVALLTHFEQRETGAFIELAESSSAQPGEERLRRLADIIVADTSSGSDLEIAVRTWAATDEVARAVVERVDRVRVDYVQSQCRVMITDPAAADDAGQMIYLLMIGANHVLPPLSRPELSRVWDRLLALL